MTGKGEEQGRAARALASPYVVLFISVAAMSWAAPLIRFTSADPLAISFWRLALSLPFIDAALSVRQEWRAVASLGRGEWIAAAGAGDRGDAG